MREARYPRGMAGEGQHKVGEGGVRRAKKWLEATTRVHSSWTVYDDRQVSRLTFEWPHHDKPFSYDLGGILFGGEFDKDLFLAECKKYKGDQDQGEHFDKFLAQSYVTLRDEPRLADHFMWITWAPFRVTSWAKISQPEKIVHALVKVPRLRSWVFGEDVSEDEANRQVNSSVVADLSSRMWMIVLSDRQEKLVISNEDRGLIMQNRVQAGLA